MAVALVACFWANPQFSDFAIGVVVSRRGDRIDIVSVDGQNFSGHITAASAFKAAQTTYGSEMPPVSADRIAAKQNLADRCIALWTEGRTQEARRLLYGPYRKLA